MNLVHALGHPSQGQSLINRLCGVSQSARLVPTIAVCVSHASCGWVGELHGAPWSSSSSRILRDGLRHHEAGTDHDAESGDGDIGNCASPECTPASGLPRRGALHCCCVAKAICVPAGGVLQSSSSSMADARLTVRGVARGDGLILGLRGERLVMDSRPGDLGVACGIREIGRAHV